MPSVIDRFEGEYEFLSNFYAHEFTYRHQTWKTSEHAFQAMKAKTAHDRELVRAQVTPYLAKRVGRSIERRPDWETVKLHFMHNIVLSKFTSGPEIGQLLLSTRNAELIEGNNHGDTFWGTVDGQGLNHLGTILMQVRARLRLKLKL